MLLPETRQQLIGAVFLAAWALLWASQLHCSTISYCTVCAARCRCLALGSDLSCSSPAR
jgi:hypothetical protein